jgi:uncharacterized protein YdaU (DUF1376 family)
MQEATARMLKQWSGVKEDLHQFISLQEAMRDKKEIEWQLEEIRL